MKRTASIPVQKWQTVVGLPTVGSLTSTAAFNFGSAVLRARRLGPERVSSMLVVATAMLVAGLLIVFTPENISIDAKALDPAGVWPSL